MKKNQFCYLLFERLKTESIKYAVLRNYHSLPFNTAGSDLDIWVSENDKDEFQKLVDDVASYLHSKLVSFLSDIKCPKLCYLNANEGIQMDVFIGDICFQNNKMIPENDIVNHITNYNGIYVLDDDYANLIAYLKEIVNNGQCGEKYILPLKTNKHVFTKTYLTNNLKLFPSDFIELLRTSINNDMLDHNAKKLSVKARKGIVKNSILLYRFGKLKRLSHAPGYVLAVEGTDGSGKSTVINSITPILSEAFHKGVIYNHLRPNAIPDFGVLLGKKNKEDAVTVNTAPHSLKQSGFCGSLIRWGYYFIDYTLGYLKIVWPKIHTKSKVYIFDRYYYDYYIDQKRSRTSLPNWIIRVGDFFVPKPDLIICLGGDPHKIYERKPETSLEEVTRQIDALNTFCMKKKNAVWIDTTQPIEKSVNDAMAAIVEMMSKRFVNTL